MSTYLARKGQDVDNVYRAKCKGFAARYGYDLDEIWTLWSALAVDHERVYVARLPREAHEHAAWLLIQAIYVKHGQKGD